MFNVLNIITCYETIITMPSANMVGFGFQPKLYPVQCSVDLGWLIARGLTLVTWKCVEEVKRSVLVSLRWREGGNWVGDRNEMEMFLWDGINGIIDPWYWFFVVVWLFFLYNSAVVVDVVLYMLFRSMIFIIVKKNNIFRIQVKCHHTGLKDLWNH